MDIKMPAKTELMYGNTQRFQRQTSQVGHFVRILKVSNFLLLTILMRRMLLLL